MAALNNADDFCHEHEGSEEAADVEEYVGAIVLPYLQNVSPLSDPRLVTYTNALNAMTATTQ